MTSCWSLTDYIVANVVSSATYGLIGAMAVGAFYLFRTRLRRAAAKLGGEPQIGLFASDPGACPVCGGPKLDISVDG